MRRRVAAYCYWRKGGARRHAGRDPLSLPHGQDKARRPGWLCPIPQRPPDRRGGRSLQIRQPARQRSERRASSGPGFSACRNRASTGTSGWSEASVPPWSWPSSRRRQELRDWREAGVALPVVCCLLEAPESVADRRPGHAEVSTQDGLGRNLASRAPPPTGDFRLEQGGQLKVVGRGACPLNAAVAD